MFFSRKKRQDINCTEVDVADVSVVTAVIISSYRDEKFGSPMCVKMFFLATYKDGEYHELFSGKKLEKNASENGVVSGIFDTPYVEKIEPLTQYMTESEKKRINIQLLFDFITNMNVLNNLGAFSEEEK